MDSEHEYSVYSRVAYVSFFVHATMNGPATWCWESETGWEPYSHAICDLLETTYQSGLTNKVHIDLLRYVDLSLDV